MKGPPTHDVARRPDRHTQDVCSVPAPAAVMSGDHFLREKRPACQIGLRLVICPFFDLWSIPLLRKGCPPIAQDATRGWASDTRRPLRQGPQTHDVCWHPPSDTRRLQGHGTRLPLSLSSEAHQQERKCFENKNSFSGFVLFSCVVLRLYFWSFPWFWSLCAGVS